MDALKVFRFSNLNFDFAEIIGDGEPFLKQIASAAYAIRPPGDPKAPLENPGGAESAAETGGSGSVRATAEVPEVNEDSDPEIRDLDRELKLPSSSTVVSPGKGKGAASSVSEVKDLIPRKRKANSHQVNPKKDHHYLPEVTKKAKSTLSISPDQVLTNLSEHISSRKSSRDKAPKTMSGPTMLYIGFVPDDDNVMETGDTGVLSKREKQSVSFTGTVLGSSLGSDCFLGDEKDQVSSLPSSWFGPEVMTFFRYADVFSDEIEVDRTVADDKFVPDLEVSHPDISTTPGGPRI
ncbi:hypothetical protein HanRHA438_Chr17g0804221 [Helianthus annuus]|uniref:Uncharacterized protein n=1 Tax=Helianthus annuus TaxID=4232 RepID=A0A9K3GUC0_HELAN|nr:hypothetical protein HanXRQr2_Chr17g0794111 [Helianthus annuus]KAJ0428538.1 hypothetical protein HanHA300_Chr17g0647261 [Helianthus annuus]KAJ0432644.1 hypothetical protein HanIR_Chr17g0861531 [Helianthus annuus]KAJ0446877.1 hypothetical protein HanHA89_Chr17g0699151 [Helianthus annuus]KAJ0631771.1 hypothetical protein HanLR1_Chr17g0657701 [Helianthus annuus]